jgi:hypothetical protein
MDMSYTQDVYMSHGTEYNRHAQHCNVVALYIDGCLGFHDILVYWNEIMLYNFRTSNYVQQRKTYRKKAATVHLNCFTVLCNTLCARIAAAVWRKTRDVICDLQSVMCAMSGMQCAGVRHIHVKTSVRVKKISVRLSKTSVRVQYTYY